MEPDRLQKRFRSKRQAYYKSSRAIDTTIYPEILVIVDYDGYRLHGGDNVQVKRYFVSFWNGVDLRYRLLKGPRIRISIAGIIISRICNKLAQVTSDGMNQSNEHRNPRLILTS
ncbi:AAEL006761-PA [Aedes aegypti]|uniref:AAEL006761-PA n=1 Tax=Aedes aegypti TaxID=7159 RepID=Q174V3_AEDAE|nr:AAEL006761-PA [Aedes aegypti]